MENPQPGRIILRFHVRYSKEQSFILEAFFKEIPKPEDYYTHFCPPMTEFSNKMHIVIDLYCQRFPATNVSEIEHKVFQVRKDGDQL
jgi:hypothetical protein